ncbi:MAG TPA: ATP-binding cassette domain-containing protein, partial [Steroidobacteraceae bacterium]
MSVAAREHVPAKRAHDAGVALTLTRVGKVFGHRSVLHNIDFRVPAGQFLAIVGRSGSGKSTLLRLLCGLEDATSGHILLDGAPLRPGVARIMFQEPRLLPWVRVLDNVTVGLQPGTPREIGRAQALVALRSVGLEARAQEWPTVLSGGQKQRVALARALVSRPGLLLLDEPLGALDALTRLEMQNLLADAWQEQRLTAVLVTHDVPEAVRLADRILLLENGAVTMDLLNPAPHPRR